MYLFQEVTQHTEVQGLTLREPGITLKARTQGVCSAASCIAPSKMGFLS